MWEDEWEECWRFGDAEQVGVVWVGGLPSEEDESDGDNPVLVSEAR